MIFPMFQAFWGLGVKCHAIDYAHRAASHHRYCRPTTVNKATSVETESNLMLESFGGALTSNKIIRMKINNQIDTIEGNVSEAHNGQYGDGDSGNFEVYKILNNTRSDRIRC